MNTPAVSRACPWHMLLKMQKNSLEKPSAVSAQLCVERVGVGEASLVPREMIQWGVWGCSSRGCPLPTASLITRYLMSILQGLCTTYDDGWRVGLNR